MEQQYMLFELPAPSQDTKWSTLQARTTPEEKGEIQLCCKWLGLNYSVITRIIWRVLIRRMREMPQIKADTTTEITQAIEQFEVHLPIFKRQKQIAPRLF